MLRLRSITFKMMVWLSIAVMLVFLLISLFIFAYFYKVSQENYISKDKSVMYQQSLQLNTELSEALSVATAIATDKEIRRFCEMRPAQRDYYAIMAVAGRMREALSMRLYMDSAVLLCDTGTYWSSFPFDRFFDEQLRKPWYTQAAAQDKTITEAHGLFRSLNETITVFSMRMPVHAQSNPTQRVGEVLLNVDMSGLFQTLSYWAADYQDYALLQGDTPLYTACGEAGPICAALAAQKPVFTGTNGAIRLDKGVLLYQRAAAGDWLLVSYLTNNHVAAQADSLLPFFAVFSLVGVVFTSAVIIMLSLHITKPIKKLSMGLSEFTQGNMRAHVEIHSRDELELLGDQFNMMVEKINMYIAQKVEDEKLKKKLQFEMMLSKIHPHFMYNTLNSIMYLARRDGNDSVVSMVCSLVRILQDSMFSEKVCDQLSVELELVEAYCTIQNYRYGGKIKLHIQVEPALRGALIPKNILQPLVENAVYHGLAPQNDMGSVWVRVWEEPDALVLLVQDDGVGMPPEQRAAVLENGRRSKANNSLHSIGLKNIFDRLEYIYGGQYRFSLESGPGKGTRVTIRLPRPGGGESAGKEAAGL